jgi:DNA polymerase III alpha subunit
MPDMGAATLPAITYPDIPDYSLREKLMLERDASGMFFSGQLLDEYSRHVESLRGIRPICELIPDEGEDSPVYDKERAKIVGVVTAVTLKTTRNDDKMAFFTLQDSFGSIECIAFPKAYDRYRELIRADEALCVEGNCSIREEEATKLLVSTISPLVENRRFDEKKQTESNTAPETPAAKTPPAQRASMPAYNPYGGGASVIQTPTPAAEPARKEATTPKLYLRVPDMEGLSFQKAKNIIDIFCDGRVQVIFYDLSTQKYTAYTVRATVSPLVLEELSAILGRENVVYRA